MHSLIAFVILTLVAKTMGSLIQVRYEVKWDWELLSKTSL